MFAARNTTQGNLIWTIAAPRISESVRLASDRPLAACFR
jgi:hypothetical protein